MLSKYVVGQRTVSYKAGIQYHKFT